MTNREIIYVIKMRNQARAALAAFAADFRRSNESVNETNASLKAASNSAKELAKQAKVAAQAIKAMGEAAGKGNSLGQRMREARSEATGLVGVIKNATATLLAFAAAGTAMKGVDIIAGFERQMSVFQAVSQASAKEMADVKQAARDMGATTEFSATQAAEVLTNFARAGMGVQDAMKSTKAR